MMALQSYEKKVTSIASQLPSFVPEIYYCKWFTLHFIKSKTNEKKNHHKRKLSTHNGPHCIISFTLFVLLDKSFWLFLRKPFLSFEQAKSLRATKLFVLGNSSQGEQRSFFHSLSPFIQQTKKVTSREDKVIAGGYVQHGLFEPMMFFIMGRFKWCMKQSYQPGGGHGNTARSGWTMKRHVFYTAAIL